jgi:GrpB-like predicted nucleotidyltransferase (UPF0157 family)
MRVLWPRVGAQVEIADYDPGWVGKFAAERDMLEASLVPWLAGPIEHVGSTAVVGLCAKPVIDIMVPTHGLDESRPAIVVLEAKHGYTYWPYKGDVMHWFGKPTYDQRTHHVHLIPVHSMLFRERLFFRDSLRNDARLREEYAVLKRELAVKFAEDREAYTQAKGPFVAEVVARMSRE